MHAVLGKMVMATTADRSVLLSAGEGWPDIVGFCGPLRLTWGLCAYPTRASVPTHGCTSWQCQQADAHARLLLARMLSLSMYHQALVKGAGLDLCSERTGQHMGC